MLVNRNLGHLRLGKVWLFACVGYGRFGRRKNVGQELFVQIIPFRAGGVISRDYTGGYTYQKRAMALDHTIWVHVSQLCTLLFAPKGSDKTPAYNYNRIKFVPVAKAFVEN